MPLSKQQINACKHPAGRTLYYSTVAVWLVALGLCIALLSPQSGIHKLIAVGVVEAELETMTQAALPPDQATVAPAQWGVWVSTDSASPWQSVTFSNNGVALGSAEHHTTYLDARYHNGYLLVDVLKQGMLETRGAPVSFEGNKLTIAWGEHTLTAFRDVKQSAPILLQHTFKDMPYIAEGLIRGIDPRWAIGGILALFALTLILKLNIYTQTQNTGIKLSANQFPKSYALYEKMANDMGFTRTPEIYLVNGNGVYNAFASCVTGYRRFTCVHAEIFHAYEIGGDAKAFMMIMAHELGHIKLGHTSLFKTTLDLVLNMIPLLGQGIKSAYGRAFEYEADRMALHFVTGPEAAQRYLMLQSSRWLYDMVDLSSYRRDTHTYPRLGMFWNNLHSSHPIGPWRVDALCHCKVGGLFTHAIEPEGEATAPQARLIFNAYRETS